MLVDARTLPSMANFVDFKGHFENHAVAESNKGLLSPVLSLARMSDAHHAWREDMTRLESMEKNLTDGADHFKQCANLAYWLRRLSPIIEFTDVSLGLEDLGDLYPEEGEMRQLLLRYGTEFLAFDFGFQICLYYELEKIDSPRQFAPVITGEYLMDVCYMMKFKHVSPHSLFLVYKSIFI